MIRFFAEGDPKPQPRPRAFSRGGSARVYDPGTAEGWKSAVAVAARGHAPEEPYDGPVKVTLEFHMPRPKSHFRTGKHQGELKKNAPWKHTGHVDLENLSKGTVDAMTILGFWKDDGQIHRLTLDKKYSDRPGAEIRIWFDGKTP